MCISQSHKKNNSENNESIKSINKSIKSINKSIKPINESIKPINESIKPINESITKNKEINEKQYIPEAYITSDIENLFLLQKNTIINGVNFDLINKINNIPE